GNWLEVEEAMEALQGAGPDDIMEVTHWLAGTMIMQGGKAETVAEGIERSKAAINGGQAFDKWLQLTEKQGGATGVLKDFSTYEHAKHTFKYLSPSRGYIAELDAYKIGMAS